MNKERKKLTWALGLVAGLGILSIAYAALSSTLYIKGEGEVKTGQVMFTDCVPVEIGTNDLTVNEAAGAHISGSYEGAYPTEGYKFYAIDNAAADAFGLEASGNDISITRSTYRSNHDGDTLTINGTKLYDYGTAVIYKVTLKNTAENPMYLSQVPTIVTNFIESGQSTPNIDSNVAVSVHSTLANAEAYTGSSDLLLQPYGISGNITATESGVADNLKKSNYLNKNEECFWFIKIRRLPNPTTGGYSSADAGYLDNGTFSFTLNLADKASYDNNATMKPAVWEATGRANA